MESIPRTTAERIMGNFHERKNGFKKQRKHKNIIFPFFSSSNAILHRMYSLVLFSFLNRLQFCSLLYADPQCLSIFICHMRLSLPIGVQSNLSFYFLISWDLSFHHRLKYTNIEA